MTSQRSLRVSCVSHLPSSANGCEFAILTQISLIRKASLHRYYVHAFNFSEHPHHPWNTPKLDQMLHQANFFFFISHACRFRLKVCLSPPLPDVLSPPLQRLTEKKKKKGKQLIYLSTVLCPFIPLSGSRALLAFCWVASIKCHLAGDREKGRRINCLRFFFSFSCHWQSLNVCRFSTCLWSVARLFFLNQSRK